MKFLFHSPMVLIVLLSATVVAAQETGSIKVTQLTDQIYLLTTDQGSYTTNVLACVGEDGVLLVDTDAAETAGELQQVVASFGKGTPKYIINTHRHVEHIGGNAIFGTEPVVIAHDLVPTKLKQGGYLFDEFPEATYPDITITDSLCLYFNGEIIRIIALPGSHDDNEIIVHFTNAKIVHLSSLVNGLNFPSVDADGDVMKFPEMVAKAIKLLPEDVTIVSGHNSNCTWQDLHTYLDMLNETTAIVRDGLAAGKTVTMLQSEKVLDSYAAFAGSYVSPETWIEYLAEGIEGKKEKKKQIYEPLYYALKDGGGEAAVARYYELKKKYTDDYEFKGMTLLVIGDKLLAKEKLSEAIQILELCLQEFPEDKYAYYTNYTLSSAYHKQGNKEQALQYCKKALELKPEFQAAARLLEELDTM